MQDEEMLPRAANLVELLDLEELDTDLYRARNPEQAFTAHLYGGQVAAQALRAAANTVDGDRPPHSVHCYFLRRGEADIPTIMRVERNRSAGRATPRSRRRHPRPGREARPAPTARGQHGDLRHPRHVPAGS